MGRRTAYTIKRRYISGDSSKERTWIDPDYQILEQQGFQTPGIQPFQVKPPEDNGASWVDYQNSFLLRLCHSANK